MRVQENSPTAMAFEEEYEDVLQNIELAIVSVYRRRPDLIDYNVEEALDALIYRYKAEIRDHTPRPHRLTGRPQQVYEAVKEMCEWRLGREQMELESGESVQMASNSAEEILACLKRVKKSVQRWRKRGGRQGYLDFVQQYIS